MEHNKPFFLEVFPALWLSLLLSLASEFASLFISAGSKISYFYISICTKTLVLLEHEKKVF